MSQQRQQDLSLEVEQSDPDHRLDGSVTEDVAETLHLSQADDSTLTGSPTTDGSVMEAKGDRNSVNVGISGMTSVPTYMPPPVYDEASSNQPPVRPWVSSFLRLGPLSGISGVEQANGSMSPAMLLAIGSIVASLGILAGSDGAPVKAWSAPPSTYLAICTAVANLAMRYACIQGVAIAWWHRALRKGGSSLAELHYNWRAGTTLIGAITAGRRMGLLGLACIFSIIVTMDGPLLQRASTIKEASIVGESLPLNISMSPEVPRNTFAVWATEKQMGIGYKFNYAFNESVPTGNGSTPNDIYPTPTGENMTIDLRAKFQGDDPIVGRIHGCTADACATTIHAPALQRTTCQTKTLPVNYTNLPSLKNSGKLMDVAPPLGQMAFFISVGLDIQGERESIYLVTGYAQPVDCVGTLTYTACTLESAIGEYDVVVKNNQLLMQNLENPRIVARANNTAVDNAYDPISASHKSTLGAVAAFAFAKWDTSYVLFGSEDGASRVYLGSDIGQFEYNGENTCPSFHDPQQAVLKDLNKLMVLSGSLAASQNASYQATLQSRLDPGLQFNTTATGYVRGTQPVFDTDYWFFFAAALVEVICIALVAPTYWGWWTIGRPVSFSPLEMAKAFEAPIFTGCNSNSSGRDLARSIGDRQVQYGAAATQGVAMKLSFRDPSLVDQPRRGTFFGV